MYCLYSCENDEPSLIIIDMWNYCIHMWLVTYYCFTAFVLQLTEDEIANVLSYTLKGLEYLHDRRKIHRDIKAGNILLNTEGHAKLADCGVAGQLTVSTCLSWSACCLTLQVIDQVNRFPGHRTCRGNVLTQSITRHWEG